MQDNPVRNEWFTIINPNAGIGKGKKDWERISELLKKDEILIRQSLTERKGHAIESAREAVKAGFRKFITVGGDGTLNEVINGIFTQDHCSPKEITIGSIPVGTGNDWGRMFGIPLVYEGAVRVIRENKTMLHDIGVVSFYYGTKQHKRYFINIAGLGFEALVVKKSNKEKDKGRSSKAVYFFNLLSSLMTYKIQKPGSQSIRKNIQAGYFPLMSGMAATAEVV